MFLSLLVLIKFKVRINWVKCFFKYKYFLFFWDFLNVIIWGISFCVFNNCVFILFSFRYLVIFVFDCFDEDFFKELVFVFVWEVLLLLLDWFWKIFFCLKIIFFFMNFLFVLLKVLLYFFFKIFLLLIGLVLIKLLFMGCDNFSCDEWFFFFIFMCELFVEGFFLVL